MVRALGPCDPSTQSGVLAGGTVKLCDDWEAIAVDPERWLRLQPILDHALELSGEERARYVQAACDGDPGLREDAECVLAPDAAEGGILDAPTNAFLKSF